MHYYNENNPEAAAMLRQFIADGLLPPAVVDTRSITEVQPDDLQGYTQCHFFAGIGGWQFALQQAGWPATRPVWTGSAPCQPFSSPGKQLGKNDERHLFPCWQSLIGQCQPPIIFGEQVATAVAHGWLDDVYTGLEGLGYACAAAVLPACSVGAPHRRDRLYFVGYTQQQGLEGLLADAADAGGWDAAKRPVTEAGFWDGAVWVRQNGKRLCVVKPSIPLLVDGVPHRRAILHALGNAIVPPLAAQFIGAATEAIKDCFRA